MVYYRRGVLATREHFQDTTFATFDSLKCPHSVSTMSLWDMLPPEIETKIASCFIFGIITSSPGTIKELLLYYSNDPYGTERKESLTHLRAWRLLRKSFCTALRPIHMLYKTMRNIEHADAFVHGVLLICEQLTAPKEISPYFHSHLYTTVFVGSCASSNPYKIHKWRDEDRKFNQCSGYYKALQVNIKAMLENKQLTLSKFQPSGWRIQLISKIFGYLDLHYVKREDLSTIEEMTTKIVRLHIKRTQALP